MLFGSVPIREAEGGIAAHTIRQGSLVLRKGTPIDAAAIAALEREGIAAIVVAKLAKGDVPEDVAAHRIAMRAAGAHIRVDDAFTGRANLYAETSGVLVVDQPGIDALNRVDESVTFATLRAFAPVQPGEMVATVKIIPFAIAEAALAASLAAANAPLVRVEPFCRKRIAVISTLLPGLKPSTVEKTLRITRERLEPVGAAIFAERRVLHDPAALSEALADPEIAAADLIIVFGASAIADRRDAIPAAIEAAGGEVEHFGMPVDPGNLLLIGRIAGVPVLGAPGCARSPKENGFDWVLQRLLAGLAVDREAITGFGVGGLLMEIITRPQPRAAAVESGSDPNVTAIVLAAGRSTRMGGPNKLLQVFGGRPLVRIAAEAALASRAQAVIVVTGHQDEAVRQALQGLDIRIAHNPDFADGLSTSLRTGVAVVPASADGAIVCLADMPGVGAPLIDRLIAAFEPEKNALVVMPTHDGQRGNPVVWARRFFPDLMRLEGDVGARHLLKAHAESVVEIAVAGDAASFDVDTPEALALLRSRSTGPAESDAD